MKIKTKIPGKQINQKQGISNNIRIKNQQQLKVDDAENKNKVTKRNKQSKEQTKRNDIRKK